MTSTLRGLSWKGSNTASNQSPRELADCPLFSFLQVPERHAQEIPPCESVYQTPPEKEAVRKAAGVKDEITCEGHEWRAGPGSGACGNATSLPAAGLTLGNAPIRTRQPTVRRVLTLSLSSHVREAPGTLKGRAQSREPPLPSEPKSSSQ